MARMWPFLLTGVIVHVLLLSAVFDIYFVSPLYHGMPTHKPAGTPPAKRVVLFVADGLRAESLYGLHMRRWAPHLDSVMNTVASWGVSHTQVPTESRPGHVAILAGFNEDPSAITRGWKSNPVDFDSVINQSTNAWCWGSPDIVDIFNKDNLKHIHLMSYDAYMQDFSGQSSPALLDKWVFDEVKNYFDDLKQTKCTDFCESGNIIFLHLLGLDTAGHSMKPLSNHYFPLLKQVDEGVKMVERMFEEYFQDQQTTYIFTSDHGMTNWGSHGGGTPHETKVPFITWGAGIVNLNVRQDIKQADIAPFISSLLGINIPINSLGIVPLHYLNVSLEQKARIFYANALQLGEQYAMKQRYLTRHSLKWSFRPFAKLTKALYAEMLYNLSSLIATHQYEETIDESFQFILLCREGMRYYTTYYQNTLLYFVTAGFVGWIIYLFISIRDLGTRTYEHCERKVARRYRRSILKKVMPIIFIPLMIIVNALMLMGNVPLKYVIYCVFPIFTWSAVLNNYKRVLVSICVLASFTWKKLLRLAIEYFVGIELLILTFFDPRYISIIFLFFVIQTLLNPKCRQKSDRCAVYIVGLIALGVCPLIFSLQTEFNFVSMILSWVLWFAFELNLPFSEMYPSDKRVLEYQFTLLRLAFLNNVVVHLTITYGAGLFLINQIFSWFILVVSLIIPLVMSNCMENRVTSAVIALIAPYTLMAAGYEHIFMFVFTQHMLNWLSMEYMMMYNDSHLPIYQSTTVFEKYFTNQHSVRRCFYLLTFVMASYFAVGNTANMNSFDPMWVRCFVTIFSPFTMAGLILVKLMIPFLIILCAFRGIMLVTMTQVRNSFLIILLFCDIMVIHFLYLVKNEGSWLEIGVSLSRFIAVNVTTIVLMVLYQIAYALTTVPANVISNILPERLVRSMRKLGLLY